MIKSILLVDDELVLRLALEFNLKHEGFEVSSADSGETALAMLVEKQYDLLLTDYIMEGMTGIELIYKAKKIHPSMKIMVFSGYVDKDSVEKMKALGADDFFDKPIEFEELLGRIATIMVA